MTDTDGDTAGDVDMAALLNTDTGLSGPDIKDIIEGVAADAPGTDADAPDADVDQADGATVLDDSNSFDLDAGELPDQQATDAIFTELTAMAPQATAALREEWGADAPANMSFARATAREFGDRELLDFIDDLELDGKPLSHHPLIWKFLARIGRQLAGTPGAPNTVRHQPQGRTNTMTDNEEAIREKLDRLHALQHSPDIRERELYKKPKTQQALNQLYRALPGGDAPIVGQGQRDL